MLISVHLRPHIQQLLLGQILVHLYLLCLITPCALLLSDLVGLLLFMDLLGSLNLIHLLHVLCLEILGFFHDGFLLYLVGTELGLVLQEGLAQ